MSVYTDQLRALESYCNTEPGVRLGPVRARLLLPDAGEYRRGRSAVETGRRAPAQRHCRGAVDPAARDAQLAGRCPGQPTSRLPRPRRRLAPTILIAPSGPVKEGRLEGTWNAQPDQETTITLSFLDQGKFTWKITHKGQDR